MAPGGAPEAYDVKADLVCYGKTLGGGLPVGVLCGKKENMTRADPKKAARVAYVIGTFAGHPAVMGSMNAFLKWRSWSKEAPLALRSARRGRSCEYFPHCPERSQRCTRAGFSAAHSGRSCDLLELDHRSSTMYCCSAWCLAAC